MGPLDSHYSIYQELRQGPLQPDKAIPGLKSPPVPMGKGDLTSPVAPMPTGKNPMRGQIVLAQMLRGDPMADAAKYGIQDIQAMLEAKRAQQQNREEAAEVIQKDAQMDSAKDSVNRMRLLIQAIRGQHPQSYDLRTTPIQGDFSSMPPAIGPDSLWTRIRDFPASGPFDEYWHNRPPLIRGDK